MRWTGLHRLVQVSRSALLGQFSGGWVRLERCPPAIRFWSANEPQPMALNEALISEHERNRHLNEAEQVS